MNGWTTILRYRITPVTSCLILSPQHTLTMLITTSGAMLPARAGARHSTALWAWAAEFLHRVLRPAPRELAIGPQTKEAGTKVVAGGRESYSSALQQTLGRSTTPRHVSASARRFGFNFLRRPCSSSLPYSGCSMINLRVKNESVQLL